jgi:hypothetical protein
MKPRTMLWAAAAAIFATWVFLGCEADEQIGCDFGASQWFSCGATIYPGGGCCVSAEPKTILVCARDEDDARARIRDEHPGALITFGTCDKSAAPPPPGEPTIIVGGGPTGTSSGERLEATQPGGSADGGGTP